MIARSWMARRLDLSRRDLAAWAGAVFCARYAASGLRGLVLGTDGTHIHLANYGVFQFLAWAALFILLRRSSVAMRAATGDVLVAAASTGAVLLADDNVVWAGMTVLACWLLLTSRAEPCLRAAASVMAALAFQLFWGRLAFEAIGYRLEAFDARLAADLMSLLHRPVLLQDNLLTVGGQQLVIYEGCASFHNISVALLCWVAVSRLARLAWRALDLWTAGALALTMVAMNCLRLFLMAGGPQEAFDFWHVGPGSQAINAALSLLVMAISLGAARPAWSRP